MSLSTIDKNHMNDLLLSLNNSNNNFLELVKSNHVNYGKLQYISEQINRLKIDAVNIINNTIDQNEFHKIKINFKLTNGNYYYLYLKNDNKYFSLISPEEWNCKDTFLGKYYYDYDKQFILIN